MSIPFSGFSCLSEPVTDYNPTRVFQERIKLEFGDSVCKVSYSDDCQVYEKNGIMAILWGNLFHGLHPDSIPGLYDKYGEETGSHLSGTYAILILDSIKKRAVIISDKTSSKPLYLLQEKDFLVVSTSWFQVARFIPGDPELDFAGIVWYLSNGVIHNDRTLFQKITRLKRATSYIFDNKTFTPYTYWDYNFLDAPDSGDEKTYLPKLKETLIRSVSDCLPEQGPVFLSLSGGYDSSGILAILKYALGKEDVRTFSYGLSETIPLTDPNLARELAAVAGYNHSFIFSYNNDLVNSIEINALWGDGISNFCDEVLAWQQLMPRIRSNRPVCLFGDTPFLRGATANTTGDEKVDLERIMIRNMRFLPWLEHYISKETFSRLDRTLQEECRLLIERSKSVSRCPADQLSYLLLEARHRNAHVPWRENFCSKSFLPLNPWYHDDCLEFFKTFPHQFREHKFLYIKIIQELAPDLFRSERARYMGYVPDWKEQIEKNKNLILEKYIKNKENEKLEQIIPVETVIRIINNEMICRQIPQKTGLHHAIFSKIPFLGKPRTKPLPPRKIMPPERFILRYLVLKRTLEIILEMRSVKIPRE